MIAKAKAISHGINDIRYTTGESQHKKHPEKIYRVLDNLLPSEPDAMGIWNSMQSRFTCGMLRFRICAAVVQPRFLATRSAARCARR